MSTARPRLMADLNLLLRDVSGLGVMYSQAVGARLGLNGTDLECLDVILQRDAATAGDLAQATGLTSGAITGVLDRLERAGFARREPDPNDRRRVLARTVPEAIARITPLYAPMEH